MLSEGNRTEGILLACAIFMHKKAKGKQEHTFHYTYAVPGFSLWWRWNVDDFWSKLWQNLISNLNMMVDGIVLPSPSSLLGYM